MEHNGIELVPGIDYCGAAVFANDQPSGELRDGSWDQRTSSQRFVTYVSNKASNVAGAVWIGSGGHVIANSVFDGNEVLNERRGGVYLAKALAAPCNAFITQTAFRNNVAVNGAGLWVNDNANGVLSQVTFTNNFARSKGGGIGVMSTGRLTLQIATFTGNVAQGPGSALHADSPGYIKVMDTAFSPFEPDGGATVYLAGALDGCTEHPCSPGYSCSYSQYSMTCTPCAPNLYSADGVSCGLCAPGTGPNAEQTGCEACAAGQSSDFGICMASSARCPTPTPTPPCPPPTRCPAASPSPCPDPEPCPGFIDLHAHGQNNESARLQAQDGVTTHLELEVGTWPVDEFLAQREALGAIINFG
eukprot:COSAG04_NODE_3037_length_3249_cov_2.449524_4_plen_359_part_01